MVQLAVMDQNTSLWSWPIHNLAGKTKMKWEMKRKRKRGRKGKERGEEKKRRGRWEKVPTS